MSKVKLSPDSSTSGSHVHFKVEDVSTHESDIVVEEKEESIKEVHLGFLKVRHTYEVTFDLSHKAGQDITFDPSENVLVQVKEITPIENGHKLVVHFNAHREKVMKETITLRSKSSEEVLFIIFIARVLGKHKGTPSLRNGIHCIHTEPDEEQDSDWQGF